MKLDSSAETGNAGGDDDTLKLAWCSEPSPGIGMTALRAEDVVPLHLVELCCRGRGRDDPYWRELCCREDREDSYGYYFDYKK